MEFASELEIFAGPRRYPRVILAAFILMNGARLSVLTVFVCLGLTVTCLIAFRHGLNIVLPEGFLGIDGL